MKGLWKEEQRTAYKDDLVIYEVMSDQLDRRWWNIFRGELESRFHQKEILIRVLPVEKSKT